MKVSGLIIGSILVGMLLGCSSGIDGALAKIPSKPLDPSDGIGLAIVYDTSGSMADSVNDADGHMAPKYEIANRAFMATVEQIRKYVEGAPAGSKKVLVSVVTFDGNGGVVAQINPEPFDADRLIQWLKNFPGCGGSTPLGDAIRLANQQLIYGNMSKKHVIVLTDGGSNSGSTPDSVVTDIRANKDEGDVSLYFIAFDVSSSLFSGVKNQGVAISEASDGAQLNTELNNIVTTKILLEQE